MDSEIFLHSSGVSGIGCEQGQATGKDRSIFLKLKITDKENNLFGIFQPLKSLVCERMRSKIISYSGLCQVKNGPRQ